VAVERVEGVSEASFAYDRSEGFVTFDTTMTSVAAIVAELERLTDYSATERPAEGGEMGHDGMESHDEGNSHQ